MEACWIENYLTGEFQGWGKLGAVAKGNSGLNMVTGPTARGEISGKGPSS